MSAPADQPVRPPVCGNCGATGLEPHCQHPKCPWSECKACNRITGFVLGQVRHIPSRYPHQHKKPS